MVVVLYHFVDILEVPELQTLKVCELYLKNNFKNC